MKTIRIFAMLAGVLALPYNGQPAVLSVLHQFNELGGYANYAQFVSASNGIIYTASTYGYGSGAILRINTNGTYTLLHNFSNNDGTEPGNLVLAGQTLYGTTGAGGANGTGTIFKLNTDGTGFTILHDISASDQIYYTNNDGLGPDGLVCSGGSLFGTMNGGGKYDEGTVFKINTDGSGFAVLHTFSATDPTYYTNSDGASPTAGLALAGSTLYGATAQGGTNGMGCIFAVNTDGSGFVAIHHFTGGNDGGFPVGVNLSGNTLYGTASYGGTNDTGTVFKLNADGSAFTVLHTFSFMNTSHTNNDGAFPEERLVLSGSTLYGTTSDGGTNQLGTLFQVNTDGTGFSVIRNFYHGDASFIIGNTLLVYAIDTLLYEFGDNLNADINLYDLGTDGQVPSGNLLFSSNVLYGATAEGGADYGATYSSAGNGIIFKMNPDGSGFEILYVFSVFPLPSSYFNNDGALPNGSLVQSGNTLYGTAASGGANATGTIFKINTDGTGFSVIHTFSYGNQILSNGIHTNSDGATPASGLVLSGSTLYGVTQARGKNGFGTIYKINTSGSGFSVLHNFASASANSNFRTTNSDGCYASGLILSNNILYGTARMGGTNGSGTVFKLNTDGTGFTLLHTFGAAAYTSESIYTNSDGAGPNGRLVLSGNTLYGISGGVGNYGWYVGGGTNGSGTLFAVNTDGSGFNLIYNFSPLDLPSFTNSDGAWPESDLLLANGILYGTTDSGGIWGGGTAFAIQTNGTGLATLYNFPMTGPDYENNLGLILSGTTLYGMEGTPNDGDDEGSVFALDLSPIPLITHFSSGNMSLSWGSPGFFLQSAPQVTGPWSIIPAASSPYTPTFPNSQQFFRLISTNGP